MGLSGRHRGNRVLFVVFMFIVKYKKENYDFARSLLIALGIIFIQHGIRLERLFNRILVWDVSIIPLYQIKCNR